MEKRKIPSPEECPELYDDYDGETPEIGYRGGLLKLNPETERILAEAQERRKKELAVARQQK